ncbi:formate dehydrogenase accessory sulfurtransferase FdhD [Chloroflexota bacterium]
MKRTAYRLPASGVAPDIGCHFFSQGDWQQSNVPLPYEVSLTIRINGHELVTILCTPTNLDWLVYGFLYSEDIINDTGEVARMDIDEDTMIADVWLDETADTTIPLRTRTPSGISFNKHGEPVTSDLIVRPEQLLNLMAQLQQQQKMFQQSGGIHCSALATPERLLVATEDIGRHNTIDKVLGKCLLETIPTQDRILLTTGRISSEMLLKASKMQTPVISSRGAPTEHAITMGKNLGITVAGFVRENRLSVFSHEARLYQE